MRIFDIADPFPFEMYRNIIVSVPNSDNMNSPSQLFFPGTIHLVELRLKWDLQEKKNSQGVGYRGRKCFRVDLINSLINWFF